MQLPKLTVRFGNSLLLLAGEIILIIGLGVLMLSDITIGYWGAIFVPMLILGVGQGLILAPVTSAGVHEAPADLSGIASGVTNTMHQIGGPIGLSMIVMLTTDFKHQLLFMLTFTLIASIIVSTTMLERKNK